MSDVLSRTIGGRCCDGWRVGGYRVISHFAVSLVLLVSIWFGSLPHIVVWFDTIRTTTCAKLFSLWRILESTRWGALSLAARG